ncbi:Crp/Fnr family transcriptional regulator [Lentzea cavernae]|uniref:Crp/Fnr family transcriptional regulator n=1 Tax=Lentzea cavernae TaxID=2020703 RepID=UPI00227D7E43|nr:Crp/Fnr family transcriptional regulator [Lentzea cavernae]
MGSWRTYKAGEVLLREGERADSVHLLIDGCVKVVSEPPKGRAALLAVRGGGSLIGELAALNGDVRSATVVACSRSPVWTREISVERFNAVLAEDGAAMSVVATAVTGKFRSATRRRVDMAQPLARRLARVLVELVEEHGTALKPGVYVIAVHLTQVELGSLIGMAESTVFRLFQKWRRHGVLEPSAPHEVQR